MFDVPIVLFLFRRSDTSQPILKRISEVQPQKIYLLCDQGRNDEEQQQVAVVRRTVEKFITWPCEIIKYYADENRGVYGNIALGAKWVFEREDRAIFLEDDNLPDVSFFRYCKELLEKYQYDDRVAWICGTNYLGEYYNSNNESYMFTRNLLPCGWASWGNKFLKYYDFNFASIHCEDDINKIRNTYLHRSLFLQEKRSIYEEYMRKVLNQRFRSWDFHMIYSIRANELYGISPCVNLIKNIGVDELSEHGGNSFENEMTRRFCGIETKQLSFPLKHPSDIAIDRKYESQIESIITRPLIMRISNRITDFLRDKLSIPAEISTKAYIKRMLRGNL